LEERFKKHEEIDDILEGKAKLKFLTTGKGVLNKPSGVEGKPNLYLVLVL